MSTTLTISANSLFSIHIPHCQPLNCLPLRGQNSIKACKPNPNRNYPSVGIIRLTKLEIVSHTLVSSLGLKVGVNFSRFCVTKTCTTAERERGEREWRSTQKRWEGIKNLNVQKRNTVGKIKKKKERKKIKDSSLKKLN
ncbi:hypothetical protein CLIB1423_15S00628 [[Candida] railenensis]|uniref:Uncharacterized protein n=1 Tax=[Candida] railenensis TaxID=45579 RepID=A0A9P0QRI1_9ASCO|nr:hypothetical protein CLIB1423_15S00628 [[Candida] railenensis]